MGWLWRKLVIRRPQSLVSTVRRLFWFNFLLREPVFDLSPLRSSSGSLLYCCVFSYSDFCPHICPPLCPIRLCSIPLLFCSSRSPSFPFLPFYHLFPFTFLPSAYRLFRGLLLTFTFFRWHLFPYRLRSKTDNLPSSPAWHSTLPLAPLFTSFISLLCIFHYFPRHPRCLCRRIKRQYPAGRYPCCKNRFYGRIVEVDRGGERSAEKERS